MSAVGPLRLAAAVLLILSDPALALAQTEHACSLLCAPWPHRLPHRPPHRPPHRLKDISPLGLLLQTEKEWVVISCWFSKISLSQKNKFGARARVVC